MLTVATGQVGDPVAILIQVVPDDRLVHGPTPGGESVTGHSIFAVECRLSLLKRTLRTFSGRHKSPMLFSVFVKTSDENDFSVEVPELRECNAALASIDHTGIELPDDIDLGLGRDIHITAAGVSGIRE